jgi:predicted CXXCH cytochrome family protein
MKKIMLAAAAALLSIGLIAAADNWDALTGIGSNDTVEGHCLSCHDETKEQWDNLSSHRVLYDCSFCHETVAESGEGHAASKDCSACHSHTPHPPSECSACHEPHGTINAFLMKDTIKLADGSEVPVHVTKPEGASKNGLARAGVEGEKAGSGLCEVCHQNTKYYNSKGDGEAHDTDFCGHCHDHEEGYKAVIE